MKHLQLTISLQQAGSKELEIKEALDCLPLFQTYTNEWETIDFDPEDNEHADLLLDDLGSDIYDALTAVGVTEFTTRIIEVEE